MPSPAQGFTGKADQLVVVNGDDGVALVAVGLGPVAAVDADRLRRAAAQVVRASRRVASVALPFLDVIADATAAEKAVVARAVAEGACLGAYRFTELKSEPGPAGPERVVVVGRGGSRRSPPRCSRGSDRRGPNRAIRDLGRHPPGAR